MIVQLFKDVGTYHGVHLPFTNPSRSRDGCLVLENKDKDVFLQPIEIMGSIEISDQSTIHANLVDLIDDVFTSMEVPTLQLHLLSDLKILQGKQQDLLTRRIAKTQHPNSTLLFPIADGDNSLKRHKRLLKSFVLKGNPTRDKTRKFIHI
jgi:hypothetical protein